MFEEKSHTCQEGGVHLRISFWHLLMNLKKQILLKQLLKWANKKQNNFNIYNVALFLKNKEKHLEISSFDTCVPKITIIWSTVPRIWSATDRTVCHCGPLFALLPPSPIPPSYQNSRFWKNKKKCLEILYFYTCVP